MCITQMTKQDLKYLNKHKNEPNHKYKIGQHKI